MAITSSSIRFRLFAVVISLATVIEGGKPAMLLAEPPAAPAASTPTPEATTRPAISTMRGIVVRKGSGKPLADVTVSIARVRDGEIHVGAEKFFRFGWLNKDAPGWLPKYSDSTDVVIKTNAKGRFSFSKIPTPDEPYTLVASGPTTGAALVRQFRPADYEKKPLRVEIDDPAFVKIWPTRADATLQRFSNLSLREGSQPTDAANQRVFAKLELSLGNPQVLIGDGNAGPLLPGLKYEVTKGIYTRGNGYPAIFYRHTFTAEAGQTLDLSEWPDLGTTLDGRIRAADGRPLSHVNVMVKLGGSESEIMGTLSDNLGRYEITGLPPGRHTLELARQIRPRNNAEFIWPKDVSWSHEVAWEPGTIRVTRDVSDLEVGADKVQRRNRKAAK
jgi:hypothetical protein